MRTINRGRRVRRAVVLATLAGVLAVDTSGSQASSPTPDDLTATTLSPASRVSATKSITSSVAQTDPELLGRTDATPVEVVIKLAYDSMAIYDGSVAGLEATSPSVTGRKLGLQRQAERAYQRYIDGKESAFTAALSDAVPAASVGQSLDVVYGGVAATVPANSIADILAIPGVVAVQRDALHQPLTDSSPSFIGADSVYPALGGDAQAGSGVMLGVLDSGVWPEHPSYADLGNVAAPPAKLDGTPRTCNFGDNPLTPAADVFSCNRKLIGGSAFLTAYLSNPDRAAAEPFHTARDSNGHGTHTSTTSAGNNVASTPVLGIDRGPIHGIAPGAWISVYKVCGVQGCFSSDSAAAVQQAILDGVDVINFSISGGTDPFHDPVELAFLDAYAANVFVAASAGNDGPGAGTANHLAAWTTTVAASTQTREFASTLTLQAGADTLQLTGASITGAAGTAPIVLASDAPYSDVRCDTPAPPGLFTGKIVVCQRSPGRVNKGFNMLQGGAVGMILYNPTLADTLTDSHWLPAIHLAEGSALLAFLAAHSGETGSFTAGVAQSGQGDAMAAFSSRGPGGTFLKPDITAPGVQILAGDTPIVEATSSGPGGNYFQAIAGTSMSSPHIAGSALLLADLHPTWTPGQIKSALMTTAITDVVKEDLTTPADPFDLGAGRVDLTVAGSPGLTLDESAADMAALGSDPLTAVDLNIPSVNIPVLPGQLTTTRTVTNVSGAIRHYEAETTAPASSSITVSPAKFKLMPGASVALQVTVASSAAEGQYFGEIRLVERDGLEPTQHLPVAFVPNQGAVELTSSCAPTTVKVGANSTCTITARNTGMTDSVADFSTTTNRNLTVVSGGTLSDVEIDGAQAGVPSVAPGALFGYLPLDAFGTQPTPVGDEDIINFNVPSYVYNGVTYTAIGVDSNGYLVAGGGSAEDNNCCNIALPSGARPNNVLAPFWTDLDGTGAPGIFATVLTDGVSDWIVIEWRVNVFGTTSERHFQTWIGVNGVQDISFAYDPGALPADPNGQPFAVGAENDLGQGQALAAGVLPTQDLVVSSTAPSPGETFSYSVVVKGAKKGPGTVTTSMVATGVPGVTVVTSSIAVT
jgi:hypothetical protein